MARPFKSKDVDAISTWHAKRLNSLKVLSESGSTETDAVKAYAREMYRHEVNAKLEQIPVERLGTQRKGLRVSTLRKRGFETVADVLDYVPDYTHLNYSMPQSVYDARDEARKIKRRIEKRAGISLNADNRTASSTGLVKESLKHFEKRRLAVEARRVLSENMESIERDLRIIRMAAGFFSWLFASKAARREAEEAYDRLYELEYGDYAKDVDRLVKESRKVEEIDDDAAWEAFERDPTPFIELVEEIAPDTLSGAMGDFDLPESLAARIESQPVALDGFTASLRRYQQWGVKFALHQGRVLLGDDMGLGKTVEAIAAMVSLSNSGGTHFLVICPSRCSRTGDGRSRSGGPAPWFTAPMGRVRPRSAYANGPRRAASSSRTMSPCGLWKYRRVSPYLFWWWTRPTTSSRPRPRGRSASAGWAIAPKGSSI